MANLGSICHVRREFGGFLEAFLLVFARLRSGLRPDLRSYAVTRRRTIVGTFFGPEACFYLVDRGVPTSNKQ